MNELNDDDGRGAAEQTPSRDDGAPAPPVETDAREQPDCEASPGWPTADPQPTDSNMVPSPQESDGNVTPGAQRVGDAEAGGTTGTAGRDQPNQRANVEDTHSTQRDWEPEKIAHEDAGHLGELERPEQSIPFPETPAKPTAGSSGRPAEATRADLAPEAPSRTAKTTRADEARGESANASAVPPQYSTVKAVINLPPLAEGDYVQWSLKARATLLAQAPELADWVEDLLEQGTSAESVPETPISLKLQDRALYAALLASVNGPMQTAVICPPLCRIGRGTEAMLKLAPEAAVTAEAKSTAAVGRMIDLGRLMLQKKTSMTGLREVLREYRNLWALAGSLLTATVRVETLRNILGSLGASGELTLNALEVSAGEHESADVLEGRMLRAAQRLAERHISQATASGEAKAQQRRFGGGSQPADAVAWATDAARARAAAAAAARANHRPTAAAAADAGGDAEEFKSDPPSSINEGEYHTNEF